MYIMYISKTFPDFNSSSDVGHTGQYLIYFFGTATRIVEWEKMETPISSSRMIGRVSTFECILSSRSNEIVTRCGVDSTRVVKVGWEVPAAS